MKKLMLLLALSLFILSSATAQENVKYEREGDLVKVAYYYEDSETLKETGYFKNGVSHGRWVQYDTQGEVKIEAYYTNGSKEGTWFVWANDGTTLYELVYINNRLVESHKWSIDQRNLLARK